MLNFVGCNGFPGCRGVDVERMVHKAGPTFSLLKYALYWYLNPSFCIVLNLGVAKTFISLVQPVHEQHRNTVCQCKLCSVMRPLTLW